MSAYGPLAGGYDELTEDVPYGELADWYAAAFARGDGTVHTVLDLCCGTGTLSLLLAARGYEMICADASADMLAVFQRKLAELPTEAVRPLLLCQRAEELDLYGTVDAAVCSLDGLNYLTPAALGEALGRLRLFVAPGGVLAFDVLSAEHLRSLDGQCFVDEREGLLCLWRGSFSRGALRYGMDIFRRREDGAWSRAQEEHTEYVHSPEALRAALERAGFGAVRFFSDGPQADQGRVFVTARRE